jgi:hypothetical protein
MGLVPNLEEYEIRRLRYMARSAELSVSRDVYAVTELSIAGRDTLAMMSAMAREVDLEADTIMQQLKAYELALEKDEEALNFDIMALHTKFLTLVKDIRAMCCAKAPQNYPVTLYGKDCGLNLIVVEVLRDLFEGCARKDERMMPHAVRLMRDVITKKGGDCVTKARA